MKKILLEMENILKTGLKDIELRDEIDRRIYEYGAERRYVPTLVGINPKTIFPTLKNESMKKGDLVLIDFGVMKKGMGINVSKTLSLGKLTGKRKKYFDIAKMGMDVIKSKLKPGNSISKLDLEYRNFIREHNLLENAFDYAVKIPGTSYLGDINSIKDNTLIHQNSIIKINSSIFFPQEFGIRIEEIIQIEKNRSVKIV